MPLNTPDKTNLYPPLLQSGWFWVALIGLVISLGGAWIIFSQRLVSSNSRQTDDLEPAPVAGHPAPDFELKSLDGKAVRLSDFKGKPVLVNFWATWCDPCRSEFPDFQQTWVDNTDKLVIIGVNNTTTDIPDQIPTFLEEFGVTFPIVLDETGTTAQAYNILGLPTSFFIDRNGVVIEAFTGPVNQAYIESRLLGKY